MPVDTIHSVALFGYDNGTPTYMPCLQTSRLSTGVKTRQEVVSGDLYPRFPHVYDFQPQLNLQSLALTTWLTAFGLNGASFASYANGGFAYVAKQQAGGNIASGSVHRKYSWNRGLILPQKIEANNDEDIQIDYEARLYWDGSATYPATITDNVALPVAGSWPTDTERFGLGSIEIGDAVTGAVAIGQVTRFRINLDYKWRVEKMPGDVWPTFINWESCEMELQLTATKLTLVNQAANIYAFEGLPADHNNTTWYFRRWKENGTAYELDATAKHIKMTAAGLLTIENLFDGSADGKTATLTGRMPLKFDGTNAPIVITTNSAIT